MSHMYTMKTQILNLVRMTGFWENLHQIRTKPKYNAHYLGIVNFNNKYIQNPYHCRNTDPVIVIKRRYQIQCTRRVSGIIFIRFAESIFASQGLRFGSPFSPPLADLEYILRIRALMFHWLRLPVHVSNQKTFYTDHMLSTKCKQRWHRNALI